MKIRHFLYNSFLIENGKNKIAIDPGQNLWIFNLISLIPKKQNGKVSRIFSLLMAILTITGKQIG